MVFTWNPDAPVSFKAIFLTGFVLGTATLVTCAWCLIVVISSKKLRKPLWLFRASFCVKDVILCFVVLLPNLLTHPSQENGRGVLYQPFLAAVAIGATSSSVFTLFCASVDRYHAATRPFRYHMGELMPVGVAVVLLFNCWMMGIITAICVVSDYSDEDRSSYGVLIQLVALKRWQKALLLVGLTLVYCISAYLLVSALSSVAKQKRESRLRLESGQEERIRSRRNSLSEDQYCERPTTSRSPGSDSESGANQLFFQIEDPSVVLKKTKRKWSLGMTQSTTFFTPTTYQPSILRRIRDTWYSYVVVITWAITFFATMLPVYYLVIGGEYCKDVWITDKAYSRNITANLEISGIGGYVESNASSISGHCVVGGICDCLMLSQGLACIITYVFADDVFRPRFLWPIAVLISPCRCCIRRVGSESAYSAGRKRTLSRNSNIMGFNL